MGAAYSRPGCCAGCFTVRLALCYSRQACGLRSPHDIASSPPPPHVWFLLPILQVVTQILLPPFTSDPLPHRPPIRLPRLPPRPPPPIRLRRPSPRRPRAQHWPPHPSRRPSVRLMALAKADPAHIFALACTFLRRSWRLVMCVCMCSRRS